MSISEHHQAPMKTTTISDCQIIINNGEALIAERLAAYEVRKAIDPTATPCHSIAKIRSNITRAKNKIAKIIAAANAAA